MTRVLGARFKKFLEENGWEYDAAPVVNSGLVDSEELAASVRKHLGDRYRTEGRGIELANALNPILEQLRSGCRPLPQEIQRALDAAAVIGSGEALRCDSVAVRSSGVLARITEELTHLVRGARLASGADLGKVAAATEMVLGQLVTRADIAKGRFSRPAVAARIQAIAGFGKSVGTFDGDLDDQYERLLKAYQGYQAAYQHPDSKIECGCGLRNCTHFVAIEKALHIAMALRKRNRGEVVAGRRRR